MLSSRRCLKFLIAVAAFLAFSVASLAGTAATASAKPAVAAKKAKTAKKAYKLGSARKAKQRRARALRRRSAKRRSFAAKRKIKPIRTVTTEPVVEPILEPAPSEPAPTPIPVAPVGSVPAPAPAPVDGLLFADAFAGVDGIITSADAFWQPSNTSLARSADWEGESGTLYRRSETAASGGSRVLRMWTKRSDFADVTLEMDLRLNSFHPGTSDLPAVSWDGVKLWLRRQVVNGSSSANGKPGFYVVEVNRRQGNVVIQKKCGGQDDYDILANTPWSGSPNPAKVGQWERVGGSIRTNADGSVSLELIRDGKVVLTARDAGGRCAPIVTAGKVGVRGDNADFNYDNLTVTARS